MNGKPNLSMASQMHPGKVYVKEEKYRHLFFMKNENAPILTNKNFKALVKS